MSRELPILFNTEMVRAILSDKKTATRRKIDIDIVNNCDMERDGTLLNYQDDYGDFINPVKLCRYHPRDILYVRETWSEIKNADGSHKKYVYKGGDIYPFGEKEYIVKFRWHPSIHMPKEAARIWLKITDVRVERLQDITEKQAESEGAIDNRGFIHSYDNEYDTIHTAREDFIRIWDSTVKDKEKYGWKANPWVWVIEFERCEKPESECEE